MNRAAIIAACLLAAPAYAVHQYAPEDLLPSGTIQGISFSPDEFEILVSIDSGTGFRMHSISTRTTRGREVRTLRGSPALGISYFPADKRILFNESTPDGRR